MKELKDGKFYPCYLLYGSEDYLKRNFKGELISAILPENRELNYLYVNSDKLDLPQIEEFAESIPFFASKRLVVLENCNLIVSGSKKGAAVSKELLSYLEQNENDTVFVIIESAIDKKSALYKYVAKKGKVLELGVQNEGTLINWIAKLLKAGGLNSSADDLSYMILSAGTNMDTLKNECDKLIAYKLEDENRNVSREDIDKVVTRNISNRIYEMVRQISMGNKSEALKLYGDLVALKEDPMHILSLLFIEFKKLTIIKACLEKGMSRAETSQRAGLKQEWMLKNYTGIVSGFSLESLEKKLERLVELDQKGKSGLIDMKMSVELFICDAV